MRSTKTSRVSNRDKTGTEPDTTRVITETSKHGGITKGTQKISMLQPRIMLRFFRFFLGRGPAGLSRSRS